MDEHEGLANGGMGNTGSGNAAIKGIIGDAENLLHAVTNMSGETVAQARAKLQQRLDQLRGLVAEGQEVAMTRAKQAAATTDTYVRGSPWQAVGIGVALGIVIGYLSRGR